MEEKKYILAVDDEPINLIIIQEMLEGDFELVCAKEGETCLQLIEKRLPDLILLDVNMPALSGLDVCKKIRSNPDSQDVPIIFVSALASPEERVIGYEAGGDDYVTKPFVEKELRYKINIFLAHHDNIDNLKQDSNETMGALMTSLTSTGELGVVINFLRDSFNCKNLAELTQLTFNALKQFSLVGSILTLAFEQPLYYFSDGKERPLERDVLFFSHDKEHIISFSDRTIFNSKHASLLIRNMPDDKEKASRFRDHLAILVDGLDARIKAIKNEQQIFERKGILDELIKQTQSELQVIDDKRQIERANHMLCLSVMAQNIEESFLPLGLSEIQKQKLLDFISKTEASTDSIYEEGLKTDQELNKVMEHLNKTLAE